MTTAQDQLDRYWADELGCQPETFYQEGITIYAPAHREAPRWMGWMVPFECIVVDGASLGSGVISTTTTAASALNRFIDVTVPPSTYLPPDGTGLMRFLRQQFPTGYPKVHRVLSCSASTFTPATAVLPVSELEGDDIHADWYRLHFDGPVFVARNPQGTIVSWAAVKCKSADVWEMAVVTEAPYRDRGLARSVVSRATQAALDAGKLPLYLHEISNFASARVCGALGYQPYGHELTCECGRVMPRRH